MAKSGACFPAEEATELLKSKFRCDFTLRCGQYEFAVHQLILYQKSEFFRAALDSDFKEKHENAMTFSETTPEALATLIFHCYTNTLLVSALENVWSLESSVTGNTSDNANQDDDTYQRLLDIYHLADRLLVRNLCDQGALSYLAKLRSHWVSDPIAIVQQTYRSLSSDDTCLRPMVTSSLALTKCFPTRWSEIKKELVKIAMQEDGGSFVAARYTYFSIDCKKPHREAWEAARNADAY
jgi:hypothetical protein